MLITLGLVYGYSGDEAPDFFALSSRLAAISAPDMSDYWDFMVCRSHASFNTIFSTLHMHDAIAAMCHESQYH